MGPIIEASIGLQVQAATYFDPYGIKMIHQPQNSL